MSAMGGRLDGMRVLDLFAGSGALGLEAMSRGADEVVLVERAPQAQRVIRSNLALVGAGEGARLVSDDVFRFLRGLEGAPFDVALADPPYGRGDAERLVSIFLDRPFASALWVEHPSREPLPTPPGARVRRYGDTSLTTYPAQP